MKQKEIAKPIAAEEIGWDIASGHDDLELPPSGDEARAACEPRFLAGTDCRLVPGVRQSLRRVVDELKLNAVTHYQQSNVDDGKATHLYLDLLRLERWLENFDSMQEDREHIASRKLIACNVVNHPLVSRDVCRDELDELVWRHERGDGIPLSSTPASMISRFHTRDGSWTVVIRSNLERGITLLDSEPPRRLSTDQSSHEADENFGACPICRRNDGAVFSRDRRWFVCHEHQLRWFGGTYPAQLTDAQQAQANAIDSYLDVIWDPSLQHVARTSALHAEATDKAKDGDITDDKKQGTVEGSRATRKKRPSCTPGPYFYCQDKDGCDDTWVIWAEPSNEYIVSFHFWDMDEGEQKEANARLLSAAPELLEALWLADRFMSSKAGISYVSSEIFRVVHTAIAKAEG